MKTKKIALILSMVLSFTAISPNYTYAANNGAWSKDNDIWYYYENGSMKTGWVNDKNTWYYLNSNGAMATGWKYINGSWYYLNNNGSMQIGWKQINGLWYYLNADGAMSTGWLLDNDTWYYLNEDGSMATGWEYVDGLWYYLDNDGSMATGWKQINGKWFYLYKDGSMACDTNVDGYKIDASGVWIEDKIEIKTEISEADNEENIDSLKSAVNKFAADSSSKVLGSEAKTKNSVYSPTSVYMALSVLSEGANNDTKSDLLKALNSTNIDSFGNKVNNLSKSLSFKNNSGECSFANSIWMNNTPKYITFDDDKINKISNIYEADLFTEDLGSEETSAKIADWISKNTKGKLGNDKKAFIPQGEPPIMEIFNTIYFKGHWDEEFYVDTAKKEPFKLADNTSIQLNFMYNSIGEKAYEGEDYKSAYVPFRNGSKMMFILPSEGKSPYDIINDSSKLNEALNSLNSKETRERQVKFKVPKFKFGSNISLNDTLKKLGLNNIYNPDLADFSNFVSRGNIYVSDVKQEASIEIDENGAEAAAFTQIGMMESTSIAPVLEKMELTLDRPFIFAIMSEDNIPLFVGVINNPSIN